MKERKKEGSLERRKEEGSNEKKIFFLWYLRQQKRNIGGLKEKRKLQRVTEEENAGFWLALACLLFFNIYFKVKTEPFFPHHQYQYFSTLYLFAPSFYFLFFSFFFFFFCS